MVTAGVVAGREELEEEELDEECLKGEAGLRSAAVLLLTCKTRTHADIAGALLGFVHQGAEYTTQHLKVSNCAGLKV